MTWQSERVALRTQEERTADTFNIVVAGHNSLVATAYLAKAGFKCLVLEGRSMIGGDTMTEELTLPSLSNRRDDSSWRFCLRGTRSQCRDGDAERFWSESRRSDWSLKNA